MIFLPFVVVLLIKKQTAVDLNSREDPFFGNPAILINSGSVVLCPQVTLGLPFRKQYLSSYLISQALDLLLILFIWFLPSVIRAVFRFLRFLRKKIPGAKISSKMIFGIPAVSVRPCRLSAPPSRMVEYYRYLYSVLSYSSSNCG